MQSQKKRISNWGNFPKQEATVWHTTSYEEVKKTLKKNTSVTVRGAGKCYGDAALGKQVISTLALNNILDFDSQTGIINCEAGVLLESIIQKTLPNGWFFHVTPGIKSITVGGAIASDVHGKNHAVKGCFSKYLLDFDLMLDSGETVCCSKTENHKLFWETCGGMGWTGVILRARFQLMQVETAFMEQKTVQCTSFSNILHAMNSNPQMPYVAAWVDMKNEAGRGIVFQANHAKTSTIPTSSKKKFTTSTPLNVPFFAPKWLLNRLSMGMYNWLFYKKNKDTTKLVSIDQYFYPLDSIRNWNRLYGRRGFVQYQCLFPLKNAENTLKSIQELINKTAHRPFLTVLKKHGKRPEQSIHSFPDLGYSLAMDFKRKANIKELIHNLDELTWSLGGKIYLAKDSLSKGKMSRIHPNSFGSPTFTSTQKERILNEAKIHNKGTD